MNDEQLIRKLMGETAVLAVVGLSDKEDRPSYRVSRAMQAAGYRIVPVTPKGDTILGEQVYRSLAEIPFPVDVVQVFRAPQYVPEVLADLKQMPHKPAFFWLQEGVVHEEAAAEAEAYGVNVVMDRCFWKEYDRVRGLEHHG